MSAAVDPEKLRVLIPAEPRGTSGGGQAGQAGESRLSDSTAGRHAAPRVFARVPTHLVSVAEDRRVNPRAGLRLPMRLTWVGGRPEPAPVTLVTKNISSGGILFLSPRFIEPGTAIELEVGLVDRPLGRGSVRMRTAAHVVRIEDTETPGWHGLAATFDDIAFQRDEHLPPRFHRP